MEGEGKDSLGKAEGFLAELYEDIQTVPLELLSVIDPFALRLEESIERFKARRISARELEAHSVQIRLAYVRDLTRLLATAPRGEGGAPAVG